MKRILCVWFPHWPIQRRRRSNDRPLILHAPSHGKVRVTACSRAARRRGVAPGMLLAEAQALFGPAGAHFEPHEPQADREVLRELAGWCAQFSPRVAVDAEEPPDCLLLDVTGCGYNFGGEKELAAQAIAALRQRGYWVVAAFADTLGAAWAVTHGTALGGRRVIVVPPGRHIEALRLLPVEVLRLSPDAVQLLSEFDVCWIGQLLELPRADLPSRFGAELLLRLDQALGAMPELLIPERPAETIEASWPFEPPVADRQILEAVLGQLLERLLDRLQPKQFGVQRLLCSLELVAEESLHFAVELLRPTLSLRHLLELVRLRIERSLIPAEVSAIAVQAARIAPLEFRQGEMFDGGSNRWRDVTGLLERLSSRLGAKAVLRPHLRADAQPEYACRYEPWLVSNGKEDQGLADSPLAINGRPFRATGNAVQPRRGDPLIARGEALRTPGTTPSCLKPQPVAVLAASTLPDRPPRWFHWEGRLHAIAHCWGPERIETGWWRGADIRRDYYLVETTTGERFWLFRSLLDESWFLHGVFA